MKILAFWHGSVMAWHGVIQRHTGRVKFENLGIVGMAVLWLGIEQNIDRERE